MSKLLNKDKLTLHEFIQNNNNIFIEIECPEEDFLVDFKDMAYSKGCWIDYRLLYKYNILKSDKSERSFKKSLQNLRLNIDYEYKEIEILSEDGNRKNFTPKAKYII